MTTNERYLKARDAADFLGVTVATVLRLVEENHIQHIKTPLTGGRKRQFTLIWKPALDEFLEKFTVKPEQPAKPEPKRPGAPVKFKIGGQK